MRKGLSWTVCLAFALIPHSTGHGQVASQSATKTPAQLDQRRFMRIADTGAWWSSVSPEEKFNFVDGYVTAMADVRRTLLGLYKNGASELVATDPQFKARTDALIGLASLAEHYDYGVDRVKLTAGVDDFYRDPRDTRISVEFALQYARDTLNGKNAPRDLEKRLDEWRALVNK